MFNTASLRDPTKIKRFKITLNNRFQVLQDQLKVKETTMEDEWKGIKGALTSTFQELLRRNKHHHNG
ncbi:unnamed protein product [Schistosoma margrebowiei]|uniref:Uncharacterized protein n=1 Tax=Schistosoma margrebowiei TaxID=48269 RepID=A0A183LSV1_9TREM|nr:unnamed protein product [Schistosoma margrebowiei]